MADLAYVSANSRQAIRQRIVDGKIGWKAPLFLLVGRPLFWLLAQASVAAIFLMQGRNDAWSAAAPWWSVYGVLANVACLFFLVAFVRREGIRFSDLIGRIRLRYGSDLWLTIGAYALMCATIVIPAMWINRLFFGVDYPPMYPGLMSARVLPLWAVAFSFCVFVPVNALLEEVTFQGFVLARLDGLFPQRWIAPLPVAFFWALQHSFLPFIPEWRYVIWRLLFFFLGVFSFTVAYLLLRRLPPLIGAHAGMDAMAVFYTLRF